VLRPRPTLWPWLLAAGPALVVVASLVTAWLAMTHADGLVADDYYRLGLTINRRLAPLAAAPAIPDATLVVAADGAVRVEFEGGAPPADVTLSTRRPGAAAQTVALSRTGDVAWTGALDVSPGRRILTVTADSRPLPVSIVEGFPATIGLHAPVSDSRSIRGNVR